jgi:hypothetical protein
MCSVLFRREEDDDGGDNEKMFIELETDLKGI